MSELDRVLDSLLHDLRSPLGVAGGYLRLLREGRLSSAEEAERAIVKTQDALRMMTTLCGDAAEWLKVEPAGLPSAVLVETFVAQVAAEASRSGVTVEPDGNLHGVATMALDAGRTARAAAALLATVARGAGTRSTARVERGVMHVSAIGPPGLAPDVTGAFDPWAYPGLTAALASRTIAQAGGRCLRRPEAGVIVDVEFDLEPDVPPATRASGS